ncbi:MAG: tetratricopeptide repeat protein [Cytophagales bacterium]|nr:tetratricopeptide repeat protein [Cytophagales bacterium]
MGFWDFLTVRRKVKFNKLYELACQESDFDRARSLYDEAINLAQDNKNVFFKRAVLFLKEGKEPDAIKDLKQSIQIGGDFMEAHLLLGNIFYERHDYQSAFDHYDQAVKCAEDSSIAFMSRGKAWMKLNMVKDAFEDFKKAISLNPLNTSAFIERANLLMLIEKKKAAIKDMEQAIRLEPGNPRIYVLRAELYISESDFKKAEKDLDKALQLVPDHAGAYAVLAELNFYQDKEEAFYQTFEKAGKLGFSLCEFSQDIFTKYASVPRFQGLVAELT